MIDLELDISHTLEKPISLHLCHILDPFKIMFHNIGIERVAHFLSYIDIPDKSILTRLFQN